MDVKELFEDNPYTRGKMFYDIFNTLKDLPEEQLLKLYEDIKNNNEELEEKSTEISCLFLGLYDQYRKEDEYREKVLDPAIEKLEEINPSVKISGFCDS